VPIVAAAIVGTALFVPESRAARARRLDPVGQTLVILVLGSVVYAIIESGRLGWTSPVILSLLAVAVLSALGILGYESRRADPLLELRLFSSVPFSSAILMALFCLVRVQRVPVRDHPVPAGRARHAGANAGLCLLPVGVLIVVLAPRTGRLVGARGPRLPLVVSGTALALGGGASIWLEPATGRQDRHHPGHRDLRNDRRIGPGPRRDGVHQRGARRVVAGARLRRRHPGLGVAHTGRWALDTAGRAALFEEVDRGADLRTAPLGRR